MLTRTRCGLGAVALLAALPLAAAGPGAAADPPPTPGGPCVQEQQPIMLSGLHSNEQLFAELERLEARRPDALDLRVAGRSVEGRPLYLAKVGDGPRSLLVLTQQHGDEPLGTEAALQLLKDATGSDRAARALREDLTLYVMPRINPDGFERYLDYEDLPEGVDPRRNANDLDLNREYDPTRAVSPGAPEAQVVRDVVAAVQPDLVLDYHHQVTYRTEEGELITMSVRGPTNPAVAPEVEADAKRGIAVIADALEGYGHATLTLYPGSENPATARNGLSLVGHPTVLIEQRGQQDVGQKGHGALTREALLSMRGVAESLASGAFDALDPAAADALPERGPRYRCEDD